MIAQPRQRAVDPDPVEPAPQGRRAAERPEAAERAHEGLLTDVGGIGVGAHVTPDDPVHALLVALDELVEGATLTALKALGELAIGIVDRHTGLALQPLEDRRAGGERVHD